MGATCSCTDKSDTLNEIRVDDVIFLHIFTIDRIIKRKRLNQLMIVSS